ncbi:MAG: 2-dehydropantoate 2-reductase [Firmicutes bacterium]|nr:2-dehydropantoate 2-reductase [Bacillota bacterium]
MRIAIYGAGSLGTVLGAYLTKNGQPVELINRNRAHVEALNQQGAQISGTVSFTVPVTALLPEEMSGEYDIIFLMTKQLENRASARYLLPFLGRNGVLCTMQNGLPEPALMEILGEERVLGCTVAWGATLLGPGRAELTSAPDALSFGLGSFGAVDPEKLGQVKTVLEKMCPVDVEPNFAGVRWSKLLINAAFSGMSAVTGGTFGDAANDKASRRCVQRLIKECIDVAAASGIRIEPVQGKDIVRLLDYHSPLKRQLSFMIIPIAIKKHAALKASMLQDLEKGKLTEVGSINGAVCAAGRASGTPTPFNDTVVRLIHEMEQGTRSPGFQNLSEFPDGSV